MAAPTPAPGRKRQLLPRAARAASILQAASRTFVRGGYAGTSMDDIAAEAGVSKLMLYRHFNSKRELYEAILEEVRSRLADRGDRPANLLDADPQEVIGQVSAGLLATIRVARELPDAYRLLYVHAAHEPEFAEYANALRTNGAAHAEAMLEPLVADRSIRLWAARLVTKITEEAVLAWLDVGEPEGDEYVADRLARILGATVAPLVGWTGSARGPA
jgi:AcrR family transcriptional regulator